MSTLHCRMTNPAAISLRSRGCCREAWTWWAPSHSATKGVRWPCQVARAGGHSAQSIGPRMLSTYHHRTLSQHANSPVSDSVATNITGASSLSPSITSTTDRCFASQHRASRVRATSDWCCTYATEPPRHAGDREGLVIGGTATTSTGTGFTAHLHHSHSIQQATPTPTACTTATHPHSVGWDCGEERERGRVPVCCLHPVRDSHIYI